MKSIKKLHVLHILGWEILWLFFTITCFQTTCEGLGTAGVYE
jgi:hypothetical protein